MLVRADGAGASRGLLDWLAVQGTKRGRSQYSVGYAVTKFSEREFRAAVADGIDAVDAVARFGVL